MPNQQLPPETVIDVQPPPYSPYDYTEADRGCNHQLGESYYPPIAWCWAILLFPIGILCCLHMKVRKCIKCGLQEDDETYTQQQKDRSGDGAYRLGFAIGAVSEAITHPII
ncbi:Integral membrane protein 2C [Batrachochytrium dendrobatidis]